MMVQMIWFCLEHCKTSNGKMFVIAGFTTTQAVAVWSTQGMYEWINGCMARYGLEIWRGKRTNRIGHDITRYSDMFRYFWYCACICHKRGEEVWAPNFFWKSSTMERLRLNESWSPWNLTRHPVNFGCSKWIVPNWCNYLIFGTCFN